MQSYTRTNLVGLRGTTHGMFGAAVPRVCGVLEVRMWCLAETHKGINHLLAPDALDLVLNTRRCPDL